MTQTISTRDRSGRTTRMLADVLGAALAKPQWIGVVTHSERHSAVLADAFRALCVRTRVPFEQCGDRKVAVNGSEVSFQSVVERRDWSWQEMRGIRAHPSCVFFTDHHAIEAAFTKMLEELHRWDEPTQPIAPKPARTYPHDARGWCPDDEPKPG